MVSTVKTKDLATRMDHYCDYYFQLMIGNLSALPWAPCHVYPVNPAVPSCEMTSIPQPTTSDIHFNNGIKKYKHGNWPFSKFFVSNKSHTK